MLRGCELRGGWGAGRGARGGGGGSSGDEARQVLVERQRGGTDCFLRWRSCCSISRVRARARAHMHTHIKEKDNPPAMGSRSLKLLRRLPGLATDIAWVVLSIHTHPE